VGDPPLAGAPGTPPDRVILMPDGLDHVPGSLGPPVIGQTLRFARDTRGLMDERRRRHGDVFKVRVLGVPTVVFCGPEATREIYLDRDRNLSSTIGWDPSIGDLFRRGLMLRDFDNHRAHRRVMQQAFRREALMGYMAGVHDVTDRHLAGIDGGPVDVYRLIKALTLDVAAEVFVGASLRGDAEAVNQAFVDMMAGAVTPVRRDVPFTAFRRALRGRRRLEALFERLVTERRSAPEAPDLLSRLCHATTDDGTRLSDDEVVDHMIFLLLAAHDTTTSTLAVMLWELARNPDWQGRVVEEVAALGGTPVGLDNEKDLEAVDRVFKEATRLHPPVPFSPRGVLRDCEIDGTFIPSGTMITATSLVLHRHPDWWTHPDRFDPDRFSPERAENRRHSHLFVPFGGGAHTCLGNHFAELMAKAVVARMLARHRLEAPGRGDVHIRSVPIPKPRGGMVLTVT
jgi:cytochrome P450